MVDEKINTIIDLGKSNIKLGISDDKNKLIYSSSEEIDFFSEKSNISEILKNIIRNSERKISNHIDKITLLLDDPSFFSIDLSSKRNIDQIQTPSEIQYSAFLECSKIIDQSYKNIKIINFFICLVFFLTY